MRRFGRWRSTANRSLKQPWIPVSLGPLSMKARENFRQDGIQGLLPEKRGPKKPRKLKPEVRRYLQELVGSEPGLKAVVLVQRVRRRFGIVLHPRTVEKAVQKKGRQTP